MIYAILAAAMLFVVDDKKEAITILDHSASKEGYDFTVVMPKSATTLKIVAANAGKPENLIVEFEVAKTVDWSKHTVSIVFALPKGEGAFFKSDSLVVTCKLSNDTGELVFKSSSQLDNCFKDVPVLFASGKQEKFNLENILVSGHKSGASPNEHAGYISAIKISAK